MEEPTIRSTDLDADLITAEMKLEIRRILAELPDKDRRILQAIYPDDIDKASVCRMFHVNPNYLRVLVYRAKSQFREAYLRSRRNHGGATRAATGSVASKE